jgi:hypothetical protein
MREKVSKLSRIYLVWFIISGPSKTDSWQRGADHAMYDDETRGLCVAVLRLTAGDPTAKPTLNWSLRAVYRVRLTEILLNE